LKYLRSPRDEKAPGSIAWCFQTLSLLEGRWRTKDLTDKQWEDALGEIRDYAVWNIIPPEAPYGSLDAMLRAELGCTEVEATTTVQAYSRRERAQQLAQTVEPRARRGEIGKGRDRCYNVTSNERGNNADYLASRLKRDAPAFAEALARGEYPSVRAACIAAGIVVPQPPQIAMRRSAGRTAQAIVDRMGEDYARRLALELLELGAPGIIDEGEDALEDRPFVPGEEAALLVPEPPPAVEHAPALRARISTNGLDVEQPNKQLGALCDRGHDYNHTGQSLRYLVKGKIKACVQCKSEDNTRMRHNKRKHHSSPGPLDHPPEPPPLE